MSEEQELDLLNKLMEKVYPEYYEDEQQEIIPIEQWLESEYYVGPENVKIYDYWKEEITDLFTRNCNEWIITGSLRSGKTSAAIVAVERKLYELSIMVKSALFDKNSKSAFLRSVGGAIYFIYLSVSYKQAMLTGYGQLKTMLDTIPYFQNEFKRNTRIDSILKFPYDIGIFPGSGGMHTIGTNLFGAILDEANFHHQMGSGQESYQKIFDLYEDIIIRRKATFMKEGKDIGLSILATSSDTMTSFSEKRIQLCNGNPSTKITHAVVYKTKPKGTYSNKKIIVFKGSETIDPRVVNSIEDITFVLNEVGFAVKEKETDNFKEFYKQLPKDIRQTYFVLAPEDFRGEFERDCVIALRKIAGVSTCSKTSFFKSVEAFNKNINKDMKHPFSSDVFTLSTGNSIRIEDFFSPSLLESLKLNPDAERSAHIDLALTGDSVGIAMTYISDEASFNIDSNKPIEEEDKSSKNEDRLRQVNISTVPIVTIEFMLRIQCPKPPHEIPIRRIREFFIYLHEIHEITFKVITFDQFQSRESIQLFGDAGINSELLQLDRSDHYYISFKNMLLEKRIEMYGYKPFYDEWFTLIHDHNKRKIDHPPGGSKDVCDAVVGATWNSINDFAGLSSSIIRMI